MVLAMTFAACTPNGNFTNEFCGYRCRFFCNLINIADTPLNNAVTGLYSNTFAIFSVQNHYSGSAVVKYDIISYVYGGKQVVKSISDYSAQDGRIIGLNNGLIVGHSSLQDGALYVFDQICPNCFEKNNHGVSPSFMLHFDKNSNNVTCDECHRTYGLLNGGVVVSGENGTKLFRYHASYDAQTFRIVNPM